MGRAATAHRCTACDTVVVRWGGRCPECGAWNTLVPALSPAPATASVAVPLATVGLESCRPRPTGVGEFDRVLAGGMLAGSVTLVFGEPGVGKSTLLLQVLAARAAGGGTVLLISAEESAAQVRSRAERLGPLPPGLLVMAADDLDAVTSAIVELAPELVVVDSVQTILDRGVPGSAGSLSQIRSCADRLARLAKSRSMAIVLVGHVTKEGGLAGPRALEHLVDTVVSFEGDRHHSLRILRAVKHRFGATGEVGLFEMGAGGLVDLADPGALLLGDRRPEVPGSAVTATLQGRRPLLVEVQALAVGGVPGGPRRSVQGVDPRRLAAVMAVLECRAGVGAGTADVFVSAAGGVQAMEPAADLALALAVASALRGAPLPSDLVCVGEVGLAGEIRGVPGTDRRLAEAARLGFTRALVPLSTPPVPDGPTVVGVRTVAEAIAAAAPVDTTVPAPAPERPVPLRPW